MVQWADTLRRLRQRAGLTAGVIILLSNVVGRAIIRSKNKQATSTDATDTIYTTQNPTPPQQANKAAALAGPPPVAAPDSARYSRHLEILLKFYAKHDPSKTQAQVVAIIAKRKGAAAALDEDIFVEVCGKLENKYGENPLVLFAPKLAVLPTVGGSEAHSGTLTSEGMYFGAGSSML
jgi:hypothetical protein